METFSTSFYQLARSTINGKCIAWSSGPVSSHVSRICWKKILMLIKQVAEEEKTKVIEEIKEKQRL